MKLRDLTKMSSINDGTRSLGESVAIPEVLRALNDWKRETGAVGVLIGGCAVSYYAKPRGTTDVGFLFLSEKDIPGKVKGFKRTRPGAFQHNLTHVEVEVLTPTAIKLPISIANKVFETMIRTDGLNIASPSGLVVLKLQRMERYDEGDIAALIETDRVDLSGWSVTGEQLTLFDGIVKKNKPRS